MTRYTARCVRSGRWWAIEVPEIPGVFSQARRLDQVAAQATDAIALMLEVDPSTIEINVEVALSRPAKQALKQAATAKERAATAATQASAAQQKAAHVLTAEEHLTFREAAHVMGLSHQRIAQLVR